MLLLFKRNLLAYSLLLLPYCLLVRVKSLMPHFEPIIIGNQCSSQWEQMIQSVLPSTLAQSLVAVVLIFVQGVMLNRITIKHRLTQKMTLFPGMIYILLCSILVENLSLTQFTIGNLFALIALSHSIDIYKKYKPELTLFRSGFWLGVAVLCSPVYLLLLIPIVWCLISMRTFSFREFFQLAIGIDASLLILYTIHSVCGQGQFIETYFNLPIGIMTLDTDPFILGYLALIALVILLSILYYGKFTFKKSLPAKKKIDILYIILLSSLGLIIINCSGAFSIFYYLWIPLSILISMLVIRSKYLLVAEMIHLIVLAMIINNHFNIFSLI